MSRVPPYLHIKRYLEFENQPPRKGLQGYLTYKKMHLPRTLP